jgi:hypothetical protein
MWTLWTKCKALFIWCYEIVDIVDNLILNCPHCPQNAFLLFALARFVDKVDNVDNLFLIDSICAYLYSILKIINLKFNCPHCPQIASSFDLIDKKHGQSIHFLLSTNSPHYPHCKIILDI